MVDGRVGFAARSFIGDLVPRLRELPDRSNFCVAPTRRSDDGVSLKALRAFARQTPAFVRRAVVPPALPVLRLTIVLARDYEVSVSSNG